MMASQKALKLRITGSDGSTAESQSDAESIIIGSGAGAGLRLNDPDVSNLHLMLKVEKGGVTAIDLGSERGTRLGDQLLRAPVALSSGDVLQLGGTRLTVSFGEDPREAAKPNRIGVRTFARRGGRGSDSSNRAPTPWKEALLFNQPLRADEKPGDQNKVLQVAMLWGDTVIDVQHFADGVPVTIGEEAKNCFQVFFPEIGGRFSLAVADGSKITATVPGAARLTVNGKSSLAPAEPPGAVGRSGVHPSQTVVAGLDDRLQISIANVSFVLRFVRRQPGIKIRVLEESDQGFFKIAAVCVITCIALIAGMLVSRGPGSRIESSGASAPAQYARLLIRPEAKPHPIKKVSGLPEGAKAMDEEGKFGVPKAKQEEADPSRPGSPIVEPRKREDDRKKVMTAGLLGAWGKAPDASNILGPGGLGTGINNAIGGLRPGAGLVDARGVGGLGSRGGGVGGGGTALGLGGLGTRGEGRGIGGSGVIDLSGRGKDTTRVVPGKTIVVGGLSKEVIAKIIRSHQSEIKYCYEMELQKKPSLFGKVAVLFTIDGSGSVSEANVAETSLDNSNTEQCMLARIRRWRFPEPQGGGLVTVNFPWVFKPAGGEES